MFQDRVAPDLGHRSSDRQRAEGHRGRGSTSSMRVSTRILLIIATCLLPTIGLQTAVSWSQWAERKAQLDELAIRQAQLLAGNVDGIAEGARILLGAATEFRQIHTFGSDCGARLASLRRHAQGFAFVAAVDADGRIRCASDPALLDNSEHPAWSEGARLAPGFTAGSFARSPHYPNGFLPFYMPLAAGEAAEQGTLVAALDLTWLEEHLRRLKRDGSPILANGVLTVADAQGIILGRDTRHADFVGRQFPAAAMPLVQATTPGVIRLRSIDGTDRLVGYTPPTAANHRLAAVVGFHEPELMGDMERTLLWGALLLALVTLATFGMTLLVGRRFITRPTEALLAVARRWRQGDLAARAPEADRRSEFGLIAAAFNEMATALQRRDDEMRGHAAIQEARVAERTQELILANTRLQAEITERRNTEAALLQAQKMQAVGQLAGGIAHDFNNVLQAVLGGAAVIRRRAGDAAAVQRLTGMIEEAARRGESVTRRLLAFSRREELRADILDVGALLGGLREVLAATLGARIKVEVEAAPGLPSVIADRGQLETVLVNLATNARDAMPRGGTLTLSAGVERVAEEAGVTGLAPGAYVHLAVADTGEGMSEATLARATEPFFTTKPLGQGTGLGLAMARSFAQGSGGSLAITTEQGRGTKVSLWLPVACSGAGGGVAPASRAPVAHPPCRNRRLRVLLADDERIVREVLAAHLLDEGYEVAEAGDGSAALEMLGRAGRFDLLVSDLAMPGLDGVALIAEAQRRQPGLPAILVTGYAGDAATLAVGAAVGGTFTLLRKPLTGALLLDHVAALIGTSQDMQEAGGPVR
jgi:signal transduction histidine kinase/ActR/RegA family two-component response regulator